MGKTGTSGSPTLSRLRFNVLYFVFMYLQTLRPTVTAVRNVIDKSLAERDANIDKMCTHIDKDVVSLGKEVKEVKQKAQVKLNYEVAFDCRLYFRIRIRISLLQISCTVIFGPRKRYSTSKYFIKADFRLLQSNEHQNWWF